MKWKLGFYRGGYIGGRAYTDNGKSKRKVLFRVLGLGCEIRVLGLEHLGHF